MKNFLFLFTIFLTTQILYSQQNTIDCNTGPVSESHCYGNGDNTSFEYVSSDGSPLNLTIDSGLIEAGWDLIRITDSDGSILFEGDNGGDLTGLYYQSSGNSISLSFQTDSSVNCQDGGAYGGGIDWTVSCATCVNPIVDYEIVSDCLNAPQFFVDVDVSDMGSAGSLTISDNQGNSSIATTTGIVQLGPYPNNTDVQITTNSLIANYFQFAAISGNGTTWPSGSNQLYKADYPELTIDEFLQFGLDLMYQNPNILAFVAVYENNDQNIINRLNAKASLETAYDKPNTTTGQQVYVFNENVEEAYSYIQTEPIIYEDYYDPNCVLNDGPFTQEYCATTPVDCANGPVSSSYCYGNGDTTQFEYVSSDGSPLNLTIDSGLIEAGWDLIIITDSDGSILFEGDNGGDLTGLYYQSTGDTIYLGFQTDSSVNCQDGGAYGGGIDWTVSCATCTNPSAEYTVIDDCDNGDQFLIDVNITSMGDANSLIISDNYGSNTEQASTTGIVQMGPYPFLTDIIITTSNDQDVNCVINSNPIQLFACPPENDNCSGAIEAVVNADQSCSLTTQGTLSGASYSGNDSDCLADMDDDVWFSFSALSEVQSISIQNITGSTSNLGHALYIGTGNVLCTTLEELYCVNETASVSPDLTIGVTYHIRVFSVGDESQNVNFDLCVSDAPDNTICDNATNFCGEGGALYGANIFDYPSIGQIACLFTTPNPSWNTIQIGDSGEIDIQITQNTAFDDNGNPTGNGLDVDFVLWGPFETGQNFCDDGVLDQGCPDPFDCPNNTSSPDFYPYGNIIDCSYSIYSVENLTINNAQSGEIYVLLVTNYSNSPGVIQIEQTNIGDEGAGSTIAEIEVDLGSDQTFCGLPEYEIFAEAPFADYYEWYLDGILIEDAVEESLIVDSTGEYTVIVYDQQCGSFAEDNIQINLYTESYAYTTDDIITCDDSSNDGIENFDLTIQNETILGGQDPNQFIISYYESIEDAQSGNNYINTEYINSSNPQQIFARVEHIDAVGSNSGCYSISEFNIEVIGAIPDAISPEEYVLCDPLNFNNNQIFDLSSQNEIILDGQNIENYEVTYHLTDEDAFNGINELETQYENITNPQTIYVRVEDNNAYECYSLTSFDLVICLIPEGISPNNDGYNDTFELRGYDVNSLKIYNRYGKLVYSTTNYNDDWEGQSNNGNKLPVGTYFYQMIYDNNLEKSGWIYINY